MEMQTGVAANVMVRHEPLARFCREVLHVLGVPADEAGIVAETLIASNLRGVDTHGILRLPLYAARLKSGAMTAAVRLTTERETAATALLDGHDGIGQVISHRAMEMAIRKAREAGVSYVTVRRSNHFGAAAFYSMMALPHGMIGIALSNASPRLAPTGGTDRLFGNNPWSVAVPAGLRRPVVLDIANSVVAAGKIRVLQKEGRPVPEGWALDRFGEPTTDPAEALKGILLAIGGHKGYGITLMVDLLTGVLADSRYGPRVRGLDQQDEPAGTAHSFLAIHLAAVADVAAFKARMDAYIDEIKSSAKARGTETIFLPGEPEFLREQERRVAGFPLQAKVARELTALGRELGVPLEL